MSTNFPTGLDSYTDKTTDDIVEEEHMNNVQDAIEALQAKIGVDNSAVTTSHDYKLRHLPTQEANWDIGNFELRARTLQSDVPTGTAPLTITSTTKVSNLNVDKLDDLDSTDFFPARSGDLLISSSAVTPSGWTDVSSTYDGKFMRISSGTALTAGGSDTHNHGGSTGSYALTVSDIPPHTHTYFKAGTGPAFYGGSGGFHGNAETSSTGGGNAHSHSVASANNVPAYIQVKVYKKN
jgi:hypothetical protein